MFDHVARRSAAGDRYALGLPTAAVTRNLLDRGAMVILLQPIEDDLQICAHSFGGECTNPRCSHLRLIYHDRGRILDGYSDGLIRNEVQVTFQLDREKLIIVAELTRNCHAIDSNLHLVD